MGRKGIGNKLSKKGKETVFSRSKRGKVDLVHKSYLYLNLNDFTQNYFLLSYKLY